MPEAFICPSCNAPLEYDPNGDPVIQCRYCDTPVIVPDGLLDDHQPTSGQAAGHTPGTILHKDQLVNLKEIVRLARNDRKLDAIKLYRETFFVGLREAKENVEKIANGESIVFSNTSVVESPVSIPSIPSQPLKKTRSAGLLIFLIIGVFLIVFVGISLIISIAFRSSAGPITTSQPSIAHLEMTIGGEGTGPGLFNDARWISIDGEGRIYIAEYDTGRVQVFSPSGEFITMWMIDTDKHINGLAASRDGTVYLTYGQEIHIYDGSTGKELGTLDFPEGDGFKDIIITADNHIYAFRQRFSDDIVHFDSEGNVVKVIEQAVTEQTGGNESSLLLAVDGLGNIFAVGRTTESVFKFSPEGKFLTRFGSKGDQPGQFSSPRALAVDGQSRVYVIDTEAVHIFSSDGLYLDSFEDAAWVDDLVFNDENEMFIIDRTEIRKYTIELP